MVILEYEVYDSSCDKTHHGYKREFDDKFKMKKWVKEQLNHEILRIQNCRAYIISENLN